MEFSYAVAVKDKFGEREQRKADENQIGARIEVCMCIFSKAVSSPRPDHLKNFMFALHSIAEAINKTWDFL